MNRATNTIIKYYSQTLNFCINDVCYLYHYAFLKNLEEIKLEKEKLLENLADYHAICNTLKSENALLIVKFKSLENELIESKTHLKKFSSDELDKMLHDQKPSFDRTCLGFDKLIASSSSNVASSSKIMFVKPNLKDVKTDKVCSTRARMFL
jgi:hypothetical protein